MCPTLEPKAGKLDSFVLFVACPLTCLVIEDKPLHLMVPRHSHMLRRASNYLWRKKALKSVDERTCSHEYKYFLSQGTLFDFLWFPGPYIREGNERKELGQA